MKKTLLFLFLLTSAAGYVFSADEAAPVAAGTDIQKLQAQIKDIDLDRNNLLKQTQAIQKEKEALLKQIADMKKSSSGAVTEMESLKKEQEILKTEMAKLQAEREKEKQEVFAEKQAFERKIADEQERANSLIRTMEEYTPEKIQGLIEDRNRLEEENKRMAQQVFEAEKRMEEARKQMTPLELDREQLHKVQEENKELRKRIEYVQKLEKKQEELLKENAEYRERVEVLKAKFKDAAPGLAKASRISQKMMRENADMHYNLGTVFLQNKKHKEAIKEYERVLELRPNDPETHYNLGILYDDYLKDREKALYHYQKYLSVNPKAPDAKKVESYILSLELEQKVR